MGINIYEDLIMEHIINSYIFTSNIDGWCIKDIHQGRYVVLHRMINDLERVFPEMDSTIICNNWWAKNIKLVVDEIDLHLTAFHLRLGNKTNSRAWDVVNQNGEPFNIEELMEKLPKHHSEMGINKIFEEWYDERKIEASERILY